MSDWNRRRVLQTLGICASSTAAPWIWAATTPPASDLNPTQQTWRALSRLGYGPTASLVQAVQAAGGAHAWAQQQLQAALDASQSAPLINDGMDGFNAALPTLFDGIREENQARAMRKAESADMPMQRGGSGGGMPDGPEHFSRRMMIQTAAWRLSACSHPQEENPLLARLTEFWFNHLNVYVGKGSVKPLTGHYIVNVARAHALGKFEDLILASARHPAMLHYLDQVQSVADGSSRPQNRGGQPGKVRGLNENYARELMELHTLGVNGGYTQNDVRELARVLTGWTIARDKSSGFQFQEKFHDTGRKVVMGQVFHGDGEQEGIAAIRMLVRHPSTAKRISLRLAQFFIADQPPEAVVQRLGKTFSDTEGDLRAVMEALVSSPEFWSAQHQLFKTPMDYACSVLTALHGDTPSSQMERRIFVQTVDFLETAGQPLHGWQTPDGYRTDAATWLVPEALTRRTDFALNMARNQAERPFLDAYLSPATRQTIAKEAANLRTGLALASRDFMYK